MTVVNLTEHAIDVQQLDGSIKSYQPSGMVARVATISEALGDIDGAKTVKTTYGNPYLQFTGTDQKADLPPVKQNTFYIVSLLVLGAANRSDFISPNSGDAKRFSEGDRKGQIEYVRGWVSTAEKL